MSALIFLIVFSLGSLLGSMLSIIFHGKESSNGIKNGEGIEPPKTKEKLCTKDKDFQTMLLEYESENEIFTWEVKNKA